MSNALNLPEIDQEQALQLAKFFLTSQQNIFIFGQKGVGKSAIALQAAQECNLKVSYINLSVVERVDLQGFPLVNDASDVITFKSPFYLPKLQSAKPDTVLLFDEVDKAPPEVMAPLLEILQFRKINGQPLNVAGCLLTGNLLNEHAHSNLISTALLDRGAKYVLTFNFDKWLEWAKGHQVHDLILGFLRSNPEFACGKIDDDAYASPSPRGWTLASEALIKAKLSKMVDIETVFHIVSGFVGTQAGLHFKAWYEHFRKFEPHVQSLIELGNMGLDFKTLMPTEQMVFVVSACHYTKSKVLTDTIKIKERCLYLDRLCQFLDSHKVAPEVQVIGLHNSFSFDAITKHKLYTCQRFFEHFNKLSEGVSFKR